MVDQEIKTDTTQEKAETTSVGTSPKAQEAGKKLLSMATLKELAKKTGGFAKDVATNPHGKELLSLQAKQAILAGLCVAELVPGVETTNDITKVLAMAQTIGKEGKSKGLFASLYKDVPKGLKAALGALDIAGVPIIGVVPELWQATANQFHMFKESLLLSRDIVQSGWRNFVKPLPTTPVHA